MHLSLFIQYVYYWTTLPLLPDSTQHALISQYLADVPLLVTFPFSPRFPCSCCPSSVESLPMICACVSQYCYACPRFFYYVYHRTALPLLLDSTRHMPISQYLADTVWFIAFLFRLHFPHSRCLPSVESPLMIHACASQYCTNSLDSSFYWLVTILRIQWLISMVTNAPVDSPWLVLDD